MASTGGNLSAPEQKRANDIAKAFGESVRAQSRLLGIPASANLALRSGYLLFAKDSTSLHLVFADSPGGNSLLYQDLAKSHGRVSLTVLITEVRSTIGDVACAFSLPVKLLDPSTDPATAVSAAAAEYVKGVLDHLKPTSHPSNMPSEPKELGPYIAKFRADHPPGKKTAFVMMSFAVTDAHKAVNEAVRIVLARHAIEALRADSKEYSDDTFANIRTYMHCCDFGIAIFERILQDDFNPNVSLETGYMLGLAKPVCLLKDGTLKSLPSDLVGKLYKKYDPQKIAATVEPELLKWLKDHGLIS
jgi:nucleoside 2-deoxyribosyltransferase